MQYMLSEPPRMPSEAFSALENAFGASEFSSEEAIQVIASALDIEVDRAAPILRALTRAGNVAPIAPIAPTRPPALKPAAPPVRPPIEEDEWGPGGPPVGEMTPEEQAKHFGEIG